MDLITAFVGVIMIAMLYNCIRDIRTNQQSLERITAIAADIHRQTEAILGRMR